MPTSLLVAFLVARGRESTGGDSEPFIRQNGATRGRIRIILWQSADRHPSSIQGSAKRRGLGCVNSLPGSAWL